MPLTNLAYILSVTMMCMSNSAQLAKIALFILS
jgi:hypothetical protein